MTLRVGVVGCGAVTRECYAPVIARLPGFSLGAACDVRPEHAAYVADVYRNLAPDEPEPLVASALDHVLDEVDVVVVATPPTSHASLAVRALAAGKPVLVEKPMAASLAECDRIVAAAAASGTPLSVGHARRYLPMAVFARRQLESGNLGALVSVEWTEGYPFDWPLVTGAYFAAAESAGGVLHDVGPHVFDLLWWWLGSELEVTRYVDNSVGGAETDAWISLAAGRTPVEVELSRIRLLDNTCTLRGRAGELSLGIGCEAAFSLRDAGGALVASGAVPDAFPDEEWTRIFAFQLEDWARTLAGRPSRIATGADGRRPIELVEACRRRRLSKPSPWLGRPRGRDLPLLEESRIVVTGASGFIGSRAVERLILETQARVDAVVRRLDRFARLSSLPRERLRPVVADLGAESVAGNLAAAFERADAVIHCAYGNSSDEAEAWRVTVDGTRAVLEAARAARGRRVVYVSSVAVYDLEGVTTMLDEGSPYRSRAAGSRTYEQAKLAVEEEIQSEYCDLDVTIIQPAAVYGPWSPSWTIWPLLRLQEGRLRLPTGDSGCSNAVHVDDVAQALVRAVAADGCRGRFLVAGEEHVSWGAFFDAYRDVLGLSDNGRASPGEPLTPDDEVLFGSEAKVSSASAAGAFGYRPAVDFAAGMQSVREWLAWLGWEPGRPLPASLKEAPA